MLIVIKLFAEDQSELDSRELDSPMSSSSELEEEPEESQSDDESLLGADTSDTSERTPLECVLCHIIRLLPFLPSLSILETKIEDRVYNVVAYAGTQLDQGAEERTYGMLGHGVCNRGKKGYSGVAKEPCYASKAREEKIGPNEKMFPKP